MWWAVCTFNSSTCNAEAGGSLNLRPAYSVHQVPSHLGLLVGSCHKENQVLWNGVKRLSAPGQVLTP